VNCIAQQIQKMQLQIEDRIERGVTTVKKVKECNKELDMEVDEFCKFQELKSLAVLNGMLTTEEGMTIYCALGEIPETFNKQPVYVKAVLTEMYKELLGMRIGGTL